MNNVSKTQKLRHPALAKGLSGPKMWIALPMLLGASYWTGELLGLSAAAMGILGLILMSRLERGGDGETHEVLEKEIVRPSDLEDVVRKVAHDANACPGGQVLMLFEIDDFEALQDRHGNITLDQLIEKLMARIATDMRGHDIIRRVGESRICVFLAQTKALEISAILRLSARFQSLVEQPLTIHNQTEWLHGSLGVAVKSHVTPATANGLVRAAELAMSDAKRAGRGALKVFSQNMMVQDTKSKNQLEEAVRALEFGEITAYYQPQFNIETGQVIGLETLARWIHPTRGVVAPADFIPQLHRARQIERLSQLMSTCALMTMRDLDRSGLIVPTISINASGVELSSPLFVDKVSWDLERFRLEPSRLVIEVLETVIATQGCQQLEKNLETLAAMGCHIDLDDFGTGYSSISSIRNFAISRIKIDRSFVSGVDENAEQAKMIETICAISERLGLDLLAEGIETDGEMKKLLSLGVTAGQGFLMARPMPKKQLMSFLRDQQMPDLCA